MLRSSTIDTDPRAHPRAEDRTRVAAGHRPRFVGLCALVAATSGVMVLGSVQPASAAATGATVTVAGGALSITVPATADLGTVVNTVGGSVLSAPLGQVQVLDARSAVAGSGWVASVISTAFTPSAGPTIAASLVAYSAGTIAKVGTATYVDNDPANLTGVAAAVTASGITGDNSATWTPTVDVTVPGGTAVGVYTATTTHSVT